MSDHAFYANILRFVATKTTRDSAQIEVMMEALEAAADQIDEGPSFIVPAAHLGHAARAFAGVSGLLQQRILPEAEAAGHDDVVGQLRWCVDTSMEAMTKLLHAAEQPEPQDFEVVLPEPPPPLH